MLNSFDSDEITKFDYVNTDKSLWLLTYTQTMMLKGLHVAIGLDNNMRLVKEETQRSNLNSKYLSVTLMIKYPDSLVFIK